MNLQQGYERQLKYQRSSSRAMRFLIAWMVVGNFFMAIGATWISAIAKPFSGIAFTLNLLGLITLLTAAGWVWIRYKNLRRIDAITPAITIAPSATAMQVRETLERFAATLSISLKPLRILLHRRRFDISPSVFEGKESIDVLLPLGFLKVMHAAPRESEAMLAHELGHIRAHDTRLWAFASAFWFVVMRTLVPVTALSLVVTIPYVIFSSVNLSNENRLAYEDGLESLDAKYEVRYRNLPLDEIKRRESALPFEEQHFLYETNRFLLDRSYEKSGLDWPLVMIGVGSSLWSLIVVLMCLSSISTSRRRSETMADLTAFALVGPQPLLSCLSGDQRHGLRLFRIHPLSKMRRANIVTFELMANDSASSGVNERLELAWSSPRLLAIFGLIVPPLYVFALESCRRFFPNAGPIIILLLTATFAGWCLGRYAWSKGNSGVCNLARWVFLLVLILCIAHLHAYGLCAWRASQLFSAADYLRVRDGQLDLDYGIIELYIAEALTFLCCGTYVTWVIRRRLTMGTLPNFAV